MRRTPDAGTARADREPDCDRVLSREAGQEGTRKWHTYRHKGAAGVSLKISSGANVLKLSEMLAGSTGLAPRDARAARRLRTASPARRDSARACGHANVGPIEQLAPGTGDDRPRRPTSDVVRESLAELLGYCAWRRSSKRTTS
jgi:hypothetical protein